MKKILDKKYIIFDMDGTLIDSIGVWNLTDQKLIKKFSRKVIDLFVIQKERETFLENNHSVDIYLEYCGYLINKYNLDISKEELIKIRWEISGKILREEMEYKPYVVELVKRLKELRYILILASATTKIQIDIYNNENKLMREKLKLKEYFDLIITKEDVKNKKPHPEIYLNILEHYKADKKEFLVFEDSLHGVMAAKAAGIEVVNIYDKYSDKDREIINNLADYKINSFKEVLDIIN